MSLLINEKSVNWDSQKSYYYFNESHPKATKLKELSSQLPFFPNHIYLFTSGLQKICILSKESFLLSAQAVNKHLECHSKDHWLLSLPLFHVGGLSVLARCFCGNYSWTQGSVWNAEKWVKEIVSQKITLSSLVPTQVYDLVKKNLKAPKNLRAVVVGGSALSLNLYKKARDLDWPLLSSYGLTEVCSQVATAELSSLKIKKSTPLKILSHVKVKEEKGVIKIKSSALLKGYFHVDTKTFEDPKDEEGWFCSEDRGERQGEYLNIKGRKEEQIKILGELVHLKKLSELLQKVSFFSSYHYELLATPQERKGYELNLVTDCFLLKEISEVQKKFNEQVFPYEKLQRVYCVQEIKKTELLKVRKENLFKQIGL